MTPEGAIRLVQIFEREGLLPALVEAAAVLDGEGLQKYGVMGWLGTAKRLIRAKAIRHLKRSGTVDAGSGRETAAHAVVRSLQLCAMALAARRVNEASREIFDELIVTTKGSA